MKLIVDIGNTNLNLALFEDKKIISKSSISNRDISNAKILEDFIIGFANAKEISEIYVSSVVPLFEDKIKNIFAKYYVNINVFSINSESKSGVKYCVTNPKEIGADLIADLAIAKHKYGFPLLIADLGTASKVLLLDKNGDFSSCLIIPGMTLSLRSLSSNAALLPCVDVEQCNTIVAKETKSAMNAGVVYSHIFGLDGIFEQFEKELGYPLKKVITGGCAMKVKGMLKKEYILDENLLLEGINYIGDMSKEK